MTTQLKASDWLDDWFILSEYRSAIPEGTLAEWRAILAAMKEKRSESFRRVRVWFEGDIAYFSSPRNSVSDFEATVYGYEMDEFISQAETLLDEHEGVVIDEGGI